MPLFIVVKSLKRQSFAIAAKEKQTVEMDCKFDEQISGVQISWSFNETSKLDDKYKYEISSDGRRLTLFDVSRDQAGVYDCSAKMSEQDYLTRHELVVNERELTREFKHKYTRLNETEDSVVLDCTWWWLIDSFNNYLLDEKNLAIWIMGDETEIRDGWKSDGRAYEFLDNHNTLLKISGLSKAKDNNTTYT